MNQFIKEAGLNQGSVGKAIGVSRNTMNEIATGRNKAGVKYEYLDAIITLLREHGVNVGVGDLLVYEPPADDPVSIVNGSGHGAN